MQESSSLSFQQEMLISCYDAWNNISMNRRKHEKQFIISYDFLLMEIPMLVTCIPIQIAA